MSEFLISLKLKKFILYIFFIVANQSLSSFSGEPASVTNQATNKLWKNSLEIEGCEDTTFEWSLEEKELVENISNILSLSNVPRNVNDPQPRNRNAALARIGLVFEFRGKLTCVFKSLPYVFESTLINFSKNKEREDSGFYSSQSDKLAEALSASRYALVGSADFLTPPSNTITSFTRIKKHYLEQFRAHLQPILGERPLDTGRYYHSEQAVICALINSDILKDIVEKIINEIESTHAIDISSIKIHGVVIDMISYYTACKTCTDTLASLPSLPMMINLLNNSLPPEVKKDTSFGLWVTQSSLHRFEEEIEEREKLSQITTIDEAIPISGTKKNKLYHKIT